MLVIMNNNSCYTDMKNDSIVLQMISFAMWGKMLTGPWMGLSGGISPRHAQTAGDLSFAVQFNMSMNEFLWHFAQLRYPRVK